MTTLRTYTILLAALFLTILSAKANRNIDINLETSRFDAETNSLFVDVKIRYNERGQMVLAGQNYRFFYNAQSLRLNVNGSKSVLPKDKYSSLNLIENIDGISADKVNQLNFDDHLGYVNLSIDLKDNKEGGIIISGDSDAWTTVARLKFDVVSEDGLIEVVWGREGKSEKYATAFVEISEWLQPYSTKAIDINAYGDLFLERSQNESSFGLDVTVGPNPAIEYIKINLNKVLSENATITLRDVTGRIVKNEMLYSGERETTLDVAELVASNYFIEVSSLDQGSIHREKIIIAN